MVLYAETLFLRFGLVRDLSLVKINLIETNGVNLPTLITRATEYKFVFSLSLIQITVMRLSFIVCLLLTCLVFSCKTKTEVSNTTKAAEELPKKNLWDLGIDTSKAFGQGLAVGDVAPMFEAMDQKKQTVNTKSLLDEGDLVLVFYRGNWCGYCNQQLSSLQDSLHMIRKKGAEVIAITPESFEGSQKAADKNGVEFPIVADLPDFILDGYKVTFHVNEAYQNKLDNLLQIDLEESNPNAGNVLPMPAVYIVGKDQRIKFAYFDEDYRKRLSVKDILRAL